MWPSDRPVNGSDDEGDDGGDWAEAKVGAGWGGALGGVNGLPAGALGGAAFGGAALTGAVWAGAVWAGAVWAGAV